MITDIIADCDPSCLFVGHGWLVRSFVRWFVILPTVALAGRRPAARGWAVGDNIAIGVGDGG